MCTAATRVLNGRFPEMSTVAPNSLIARAQAHGLALEPGKEIFLRRAEPAADQDRSASAVIA